MLIAVCQILLILPVRLQIMLLLLMQTLELSKLELTMFQMKEFIQ